MKASDMIKESVRDLPPSGIRKYFDMVEGMDDVISLGVGEPDFQTPWNVREAGIYSLEKGRTKYTSNQGLMALRNEISTYVEHKYNVEYNAKTDVLVTVGGSEAIDLALRILVGPGDEVIIPEPSFVAYKGCTLLTGATPVSIALKAEDEFKLTPEQLENAITSKTKVLILPFPNNPTGAIMNREELEKIVNVLKDKDIVVISDEIYAELTYEGKHVSIASFPEMKDKTILINGFSKTYSMTGWRLGYACADKAFISNMTKIHQYAIMSAPTTSQWAAIEALRNGEDSVQAMRSDYNKRRRVIVDGFREMGLDCFEPKGAFYVFPCIKSTGLSSDEFCERLLKEGKVLAVPGNAFGDSGEGYIRTCYALSMKNLYEALKRIKKFVSQL